MKISIWVNDAENMTWQAAMRFSMVVLSSLLFGIYYGQSLPPEVGELCRSFALSGLAFYFSLELVADQRAYRRTLVCQRSAERNLARRLGREDKMALFSEVDNSSQHSSEGVESAQETGDDLAVYQGANTQAVLSA